jgi:hypothetical protein
MMMWKDLSLHLQMLPPLLMALAVTSGGCFPELGEDVRTPATMRCADDANCSTPDNVCCEHANRSECTTEARCDGQAAMACDGVVSCGLPGAWCCGAGSVGADGITWFSSYCAKGSGDVPCAETVICRTLADCPPGNSACVPLAEGFEPKGFRVCSP